MFPELNLRDQRAENDLEDFHFATDSHEEKNAG